MVVRLEEVGDPFEWRDEGDLRVVMVWVLVVVVDRELGEVVFHQSEAEVFLVVQRQEVVAEQKVLGEWVALVALELVEVVLQIRDGRQVVVVRVALPLELVNH